MRTLAAVLLLTALATSAQAADKDTEADWIRKPSPEMLRAVWPKAALGSGKGAQVVLGCKVSAQGLLFDCKVISETPQGLGFGGAALAMTPQLLMKPARHNGQPVVSDARIPIKFEAPGIPLDSFGSRPVIEPAMAWQRAPTYAEVAAAYPEKARKAGIGGLVSVSCHLSDVGALAGCSVTREEPNGYGFGSAARALTKLFQAYPAAPGGPKLDGASVQLPVAFDPVMLKPGEQVVGKPRWVAAPSSEALSASLPKGYKALGVVRVVMQCRIEQGGYVSGCQLQREEPAGEGLGQAALQVADKIRVGTWTMEGLPAVGGVVSIPIRYDLREQAAAPTPPKP